MINPEPVVYSLVSVHMVFSCYRSTYEQVSEATVLKFFEVYKLIDGGFTGTVRH